MLAKSNVTITNKTVLRTLLEKSCFYQHAEDYYLKSSPLVASCNKSSQITQHKA